MRGGEIRRRVGRVVAAAVCRLSSPPDEFWLSVVDKAASSSVVVRIYDRELSASKRLSTNSFVSEKCDHKRFIVE